MIAQQVVSEIDDDDEPVAKRTRSNTHTGSVWTLMYPVEGEERVVMMPWGPYRPPESVRFISRERWFYPRYVKPRIWGAQTVSALCAGMNPRLGKRSMIFTMPFELLEKIVKMLYCYYTHKRRKRPARRSPWMRCERGNLALYVGDPLEIIEL